MHNPHNDLFMQPSRKSQWITQKGPWNSKGYLAPTVDKLLLLFSRSVLSDSSWSHELQLTRVPCPSLSPGVCSDLCPSSRWCHPTISSSVVPFSCLQSFPASVSFSVSQFFTSSGQSIGASASASVFPMNIQGWFPGNQQLTIHRIQLIIKLGLIWASWVAQW